MCRSPQSVRASVLPTARTSSAATTAGVLNIAGSSSRLAAQHLNGATTADGVATRRRGCADIRSAVNATTAGSTLSTASAFRSGLPNRPTSAVRMRDRRTAPITSSQWLKAVRSMTRSTACRSVDRATPGSRFGSKARGVEGAKSLLRSDVGVGRSLAWRPRFTPAKSIAFTDDQRVSTPGGRIGPGPNLEV